MTEPRRQTAAQETFLSHLIELRTRLMRSIIAVVVVLVLPVPVGEGNLRAARGAAAADAAGRRDDDRHRRHRHVPRAAQGDADGGVPDRAAVRAVAGVGVRRARASTSTRSGWRCP